MWPSSVTLSTAPRAGSAPGRRRKVVCQELVCPGAHDEQWHEHAACLLDGGSLIGRVSVAAHLREEREPTCHHRPPARGVEQHVLMRSRACEKRDRGYGSVTRERRFEGTLANAQLARAERRTRRAPAGVHQRPAGTLRR